MHYQIKIMRRRSTRGRRTSRAKKSSRRRRITSYRIARGGIRL
ncbi:hypothetical protein [Flyfo microvirus Tbat1_59]|nr:hypothetical protein [Flyfo microvirus Tbat1_59]